MKKRIWIISICIAVVLFATAAAVAIIGFWRPYQEAETTMDGGTMELVCHEDGSLILSWPQSTTAEQYHVEILIGNEILFEEYLEDTLQCQLPELPLSEKLTVRISSIGFYRFFFDDTPRMREGTTALEVKAVLAPPAIDNLLRANDPDNNTMLLQFKQQPDSTIQLFLCDDLQNRQLVKATKDGEFSITFDENGDLDALLYGQNLTFAFTGSRSIDGMDLHWYGADRVTVCREDFLGTKLCLETIDEGDNRFILHWEETKGDHQLLQQWNAETETWDTIRKYGHQDTLTYDTGHLPKYNSFTYRVIGVGGQTMPDSEFSTVPEEVTLNTGASPLFATIWPIQKLDVYDRAEGGTVIASVPEGKAFSVKELRNGMFLIRYEGEKLGYVDSNYCMINLPEYMDDRCVYHITNSFHSRYMIHNYGIPEVTDKITTGYENVDLGNKQYLVPLLYPAARKLDRAATAAISEGYKLMIYDSYRPRKATLELYDIASKLLKEPLPPEDYYEMPGENAGIASNPDATPVTYSMLMTDNGRYKLNFFLAKGGSRHNMGVALDLTLIDLSTGEEVEMQTLMHDLSWYSETSKNNQNAALLSNIMHGAGFGGLSSEWWHFQDNDAVKDLKLTNYMQNGISAECWKADANGWRYRRADGRYETDCIKTIDGIKYQFDMQGYATAVDSNARG